MYRYGKLFKTCRQIFRTYNGNQQIIWEENILPTAIYVTHHQNLYGPMTALAWFPIPMHIWALHVFFDKQKCFEQFYEYTFTKRMRMGKIQARIFARLLAPFVSNLLKSGGAIPVYRGRRSIFETIDLSIEALERGESLLISPDVDYADGEAQVKEIYLGFLNLEKYYHKKTGQHIPFIPLYCNRHQHTIHVGSAIVFQDGAPFAEERQRVADILKKELNTFSDLESELE